MANPAKVRRPVGAESYEVDSGGALNMNSGSTQNLKSGSTFYEQAGAAIKRKPIVVAGASPVTLVAADSGNTYYCTVADVVFNLPATIAGFWVKVIVGVASGGTGVSISPVAADKITGRGVATPADDKDLINTGATDVVGDSVTLIGDGVDGYYIADSEGIWAREA